MPTEPTAPPPVATDGEPVSPSGAVLAALEAALEMLSERHGGHVPEWEFCEGVMTALLCTRRTVGSDEWLPMLFGMDAGAVFATPGEQTHFLMHWMERAEQVRTALEAPVEALDDERALEPGVVDWQGFLYDCDFNQQLGMDMQLGSTPRMAERPHLRALLHVDPRGTRIRVADHCYGCTAGQGSSCGGALHA